MDRRGAHDPSTRALPHASRAGRRRRAGRTSGRAEERAAYSQRVAKVKPTAMKPMPTKRFFWPRSLKTGTLEVSLAMA